MTIPACVNSLLLAMGGDPLDSIAKVGRSVRLRASASAYFSRTFVAPTNGTKWTWRGIVKKGDVSGGSAQILLAAPFSSGQVGLMLSVNGGTQLGYVRFDGSTVTSYVYDNAQRRDPSAHYDICVRFDSSLATNTARLIIEVNGVTSTLTIPNDIIQNNTDLNSAGVRYFGCAVGASTKNTDALFSKVCFVDGVCLPATTFGIFHPATGQWRPKSDGAIRAAVLAGGTSIRAGWGANGSFLTFNDATSLTTLGYDRSQSDTDTSGNNWMATNISLTAGATYDSMLDTPTRNFATLNPLIPTVGAAFKDGNLRCGATGSYYTRVAATMSVKPGQRRYFEAKTGGQVGVVAAPIAFSTNESLGANTGQYSYRWDGNKNTQGTITTYGATFTSANVIGCDMDYTGDSMTMTFYKDGVLVGAAFTGLTASEYFPAIGSASDGADFYANFGASGWWYPVDLAKTLDTKNLPYPKIQNPKSAFVAIVDTGATIQATLAAARSGWPSYIDIIKCRSAAEGWRCIFSDDPTNYLDSSSSGAKAAVPSFSGTSYAGYSLKVAANNSVATGRLTHVSGIADTVADGLVSSRKMVFLKNEASGTWYVYHPDLTAGKLLYLEQITAETTDATISNVTATSFTVAAALASGTYRWLALAEVENFLKLGKHTGNGLTNGPFDSLGFSPAFVLVKRINTTGGFWDIVDSMRDPVNSGSENQLYLQSTGAETDSTLLDFTADGLKVRSTDGTVNLSGDSVIFVALAELPFRYANAR